jgi:hypothetical protein
MFTPGSRACAYKSASGLGKWLSKDPIQERGGKNLYEFANNNAINALDPDGKITIQSGKLKVTECGGYYVEFYSYLDNPNPPDGYWVQEVTVTKDVGACKQNTKQQVEHFWEYGKLGGSKTSLTDVSSSGTWHNFHGTVTATGVVKYFSAKTTGDLESDPNWKKGGNGRGPNTETKPPWWDNPSDNGESTGNRSVTDTFDCCCSSSKTDVRVSP